MDKFIENPNIPVNRVSLGIVDGRAGKAILEALNKSGIHIITTGRCEGLYEAVAYHPDMFFHHVGYNRIVAAPNAPEDTVKELMDKGFNIIKGERFISSKYPYDIAYNVARMGHYAICNEKYTDRILLQILTEMGVGIIDVKQGYAKCSICIVDSKSAITSDKGIQDILLRNGFDVLRIEAGSIVLESVNYGFIGGASGLISGEIMAFTGSVMLHPDFEKINKFLTIHGKNIKMLDDGEMVDIGTFIPLKEYCEE